MLQIKNISKQYVTAGLVQRALDNVSLNLRDSEFVAILGPSGSGKTTLLNIVGGLDTADSGHLVINGVSTERYSDRDWDAYRNHTIGFVFQSYNLIPHQTVLANVELALTISGISRRERRARAAEALQKVGLGEQLHKKPNQMSGGQMQRVAIARALVNDPDILLADEPTGALDSETSVQVMELLKEVARDRLVVMVTHNPELAAQYATRTITLRDGVIRSDTDPYEVDDGALAKPEHRRLGKASMSFWTALTLSFNNLKTKKARTLLTSFAGSIGIIGIAAILSLSTGVDVYIKNMESETLAEYPLQVTKTGFNIAGMMTMSAGASQTAEEHPPDEIRVVDLMSAMFSTMDTNDLASLKTYLDSDESGISSVSNAIEYTYNVTPQIFLEYGDTVRQVHPDQRAAAMGFGNMSGNSLMSAMMNSNVFFKMPENETLYKTQYDLLAGHWPESYNELVLVLTQGGAVGDFLLYTMGLRDPLELDEVIKQFMNEDYVALPPTDEIFRFDDMLGIEFKLIDAADVYVYDEQYGATVDKSGDKRFMKELVASGETLTVVGIARLSPDANGAALSSGLNYPSSLVAHLAERAAEKELVKRQLADTRTDVFTGEEFGEEPDRSEFDMSSLFTVDTEALSGAFSFDSSAIEDKFAGALDMGDIFSGLDLGSVIDFQRIMSKLPPLPSISLEELIGDVEINYNGDELSRLAEALTDGYGEYAKAHPEADYSTLADDFAAYLGTDEARAALSDGINDILSSVDGLTVTTDSLRELVTGVMADFLRFAAERGYTDSDRLLEYLAEYLATPGAQDYLDRWADENLQLNERVELTTEQVRSLASALLEGYSDYAEENGLPDPSKIGEHLADYLSTPEARQIVADAIAEIVDVDALAENVSAALGDAMGDYADEVARVLSREIGSAMEKVMRQVGEKLEDSLSDAFGDLGGTMEDAMSFDADAFAGAFKMNMDGEELGQLMASMSVSENATLDGNLQKLGYVDFASPTSISIYPRDFESKGRVVEILDGYNDRMKELGEDDKVISYTDMVGTLMSSVTTIVDVISYVLIAFVAISLVVSSIMIGVITYISVLERKKEIGILRAIGASKRNISQVFNAETIIIGFCAGVIGIGATELLLIPVNAIIHHLSGIDSVSAVLPVVGAVVLIVLSVFLTYIGGLIPAGKASRSDPVQALRTE